MKIDWKLAQESQAQCILKYYLHQMHFRINYKYAVSTIPVTQRKMDTSLLTLKPQDSFGEFNNFFLDLQKVQEIIRKYDHTILQLFGMTYCNATLPNGKLSLCT